ncbi:MAG: gliding motility-associated C-terminal domain-containing protein [Agriterribacter sp.]
MTGRCVLVFLLNVWFSCFCYAQTCSTLGQNPGTAFPVCGTSVFTQQTVPGCGGRTIPVPGCNDGAAYGDLNPYWYKFTCFTGGTLGFTITPITSSDDYDWQLFDITGHQPEEVYTNQSLYVTSNWSAVEGATGTTTTATAVTNCAGYSYPNKSKMPVLIKGHQYLLLVSHFTDTNQSGYKLTFSGGTANITDPTIPALESARAYCDGQSIILKLNKKMRCNTLAKDGSDFQVNAPSISVTGATAPACGSGFDMDSVVINLNAPLPFGTYLLIIKTGSDGNTILDNCDRNIADGDKIDFTVAPAYPTPMDSLAPIECSPDMLRLVFKKPIRCNSIAPGGSDFVISGTSSLSVVSAYGDCGTDNLTSAIYVKLNRTILQKGAFTITLQKGTDGNTLIDECGKETPAGQSLNFNVLDTVSADFGYGILLGCRYDTISLHHPGGNDINSWNWIFEDGSSGSGQDFEKIYTAFGQKHVTLLVSNGMCSDTASADILLDNELKADFEAPEFICPNDTTVYKDLSIGHILSWVWDFGNGTQSISQLPSAQQYPPPVTDKDYTVNLSVTDNIGCVSEISKTVKVVASCYIAIPSAFTPNGDYLNDYLYPLNAYKADDLMFRVYNLYGQKVFETNSRLKKWDGTINGKMQRAGTYVWTLHYVHKTTRQVFNLKGTTTLIR